MLVSGSGSNLQAILDAIDGGLIQEGRVALVLSDRAGAYALERARARGISSAVVDRKTLSRDAFDEQLEAKLREAHVDAVVLAGYLSILSPRIVAQYANRIINIHPSLIPSFCGKGFHGLKVHEAVLNAGVQFTGVTVHLVDESVDGGAILLQRVVAVANDDTPQSLSERVLAVEHEAIVAGVQMLLKQNYTLVGKRVVSNEKALPDERKK